jgi:hypothetical protein
MRIVKHFASEWVVPARLAGALLLAVALLCSVDLPLVGAGVNLPGVSASTWGSLGAVLTAALATDDDDDRRTHLFPPRPSGIPPCGAVNLYALQPPDSGWDLSVGRSFWAAALDVACACPVTRPPAAPPTS